MQPPSGGTAQGFHSPFSSSTGPWPPCEVAGRMCGLQVLPTTVSVNAPKAVSTSTVDSASCMRCHSSLSMQSAAAQQALSAHTQGPELPSQAAGMICNLRVVTTVSRTCEERIKGIVRSALPAASPACGYCSRRVDTLKPAHSDVETCLTCLFHDTMRRMWHSLPGTPPHQRQCAAHDGTIRACLVPAGGPSCRHVP